jgi:hypothetical protein
MTTRLIAAIRIAIVGAFSPALPGGADLLGQEHIVEKIDGLTVIVPADEEDLAVPLHKLAKSWRGAIDKGVLSRPLRGYLENPDAARNSKRRVAEHLGVKDDAEAVAAIARDWDEVANIMQKILSNWETWQQSFDTVRFWPRKEVEKQTQRNQRVFDDTLLQINPSSDDYGFRIRPNFLTEPLDLDAAADPKNVRPHRLDFVLDYPLGATDGQIIKRYNDLLNSSVRNTDFGVIGGSAADIYEAAYRRVFEMALERHTVTGDDGAFFRHSISFAFNAARNDQIQPKRGRKMLFGQRLRNVAPHEWKVPIDELVKRIRNTPAWPAESDGPAEQATREVALAMVFLSLKNGGTSVDGWFQAQENPLDAKAFSKRLDKAATDDEGGWETVFRRYCGSLADQFASAFSEKAKPAPHSTLSSIEEARPRAISGIVEVVHPVGIEEAAQLSAEKISRFLNEFAEENSSASPAPAFGEKHIQTLSDHGLRSPQRSPEQWRSVLNRMAKGGIYKLLIRVWSQADAVNSLRQGIPIPGMTLDTATDEVTVTMNLNWQDSYRIPDVADRKSLANKDIEEPSYLIVPLTAEQMDRPAGVLAEAIAGQCREHLTDMLSKAGDKVAGEPEEIFFTMSSMVAGEALFRDVIASKDCEWFVMGLSHWLAIQLTDAEFGDGAGRRVFEKRWPPEKNRANRDAVNLITWPLVNDREESDSDATHIFYSVLAIEAALKNRDAGFVKKLLEEIRHTPRKRANMGTVYRAFKKVGGVGNLKKIAAEI